MVSMFDLQCFHNEYTAEGQQEIDAIITVTCGSDRSKSGVTESPGAPAAEVIIIDTSGSMHGKRITEARRATVAAIECIRDGARFAIVDGDDRGRLIYPRQGKLAESNPGSRSEAAGAVRRLRSGGGTAIGRWIDTATDLLAAEPGVRHVILLTDGKDESEKPEELDAALARAEGQFQCDCRGVGADWNVAELRRVAHALLGTVDIVADPSHLTIDFEAMMAEAMGKAVADVALRVWTPEGAEVAFFKQVAPEIVDLTSARRHVDEMAGDYATGSWGDESRDYHLAVRIKPVNIGDEMLAARISAIVDGMVAGQVRVQVTGTDEPALSTRINPHLAHYTGQQEMAEAIQDGLDALKHGDPDTAVVKLGRAVRLAAESDNQEKVDLLAGVVDIDDADTGRVRLKRQIEVEDEMTLDTRSTKTARVRR